MCFLELCIKWSVVALTQDGDKFWRMPECYIRGSTIKYLRIPDEIIDMVKEEVVSKGRGRGGMQQNKGQPGKGRGGGAGRGTIMGCLVRWTTLSVYRPLPRCPCQSLTSSRG